MSLFARIIRFPWGKRNAELILIAALLFVLNQFLEFIVLKLSGNEYSNLCSFDCGWYSTIVEDGYDLEPHRHLKADAANWGFFPALPIIAKIITYITGFSPGISLVLVAKVFFLLSIFSFIKLSLEYNPKLHPVLVGTVLVFNPYSIYGNVGYTESLFLFVSCNFFYFLKRRNYIAAGILGGFLTSVRLVGVAAVLSYAIKMCEEFFVMDDKNREVILLGWLIIPLGLSAFMLFLYFWTGDALAFSHIQVAWGRILRSPIMYIVNGIQSDSLGKYWAAMAILALIAAIYLAAKKHFDLALFSVFCTVLPLSTELFSMPRFIWWQAPILLTVATLLSKKWAWIVFCSASIAGLTFMYFSWFAGKGFVI